MKRKALRRPWKTDIKGADVTCWGRLFQVRAAATGKARSPTMDSSVRRAFSVSEEADRNRLRTPVRCRDTTLLSRADTCTCENNLNLKSNKQSYH